MIYYKNDVTTYTSSLYIRGCCRFVALTRHKNRHIGYYLQKSSENQKTKEIIQRIKIV